MSYWAIDSLLGLQEIDHVLSQLRHECSVVRVTVGIPVGSLGAGAELVCVRVQKETRDKYLGKDGKDDNKKNTHTRYKDKACRPNTAVIE